MKQGRHEEQQQQKQKTKSNKTIVNWRRTRQQINNKQYKHSFEARKNDMILKNEHARKGDPTKTNTDK